MFEIINFYLVPGLVLGSIYALGAIGITMVFAVFGFANIAHGDLATTGAYLVFFFVTTLGLSPYTALIPAMIGMAVVAVAIHFLFFDYLRKRPLIVTVMASLGVALMLRSIIQVTFGVDSQHYTTGIARPHDFWGFKIKTREIVTLVCALGLAGAVGIFLRHTRYGKSMRAMADNADLASLCGIDRRLIVIFSWAVVGVLVTASGFFLGLNAQLTSTMGWGVLLPMFAATIIGGVGDVRGALLGGFFVGMFEELAVFVVPFEYKTALALLVLVLVLLFRPQGFFGSASSR